MIDTLLLLVSPLIALELRLDGQVDWQEYGLGLIQITFLFLIVKLAILFAFGFYKRCWRYADADELQQVAGLALSIVVLQTLLFTGLYLGQVGAIANLPRSLPILDGILSVLLVSSLHFSVRIIERSCQKRSRSFNRRDRVLVVGAGDAGVSLVREMQRHPHLQFHPVAFIDDDPAKLNLQICQTPVVGDRYTIPKYVRSLHIRKVVIAIPSLPGQVLREILEICNAVGVPTSTLPGIDHILNGQIRLSDVRDIQIEDLLRREPIQMDVQQVLSFLKGKRVLVTGAGGSIGSELCRQILKCCPAEIALVGHGENSVFLIQQELERTIQLFQESDHFLEQPLLGQPLPEQTPRLSAYIADIRFCDRLEYVFDQFRPNIVFHAAAHKHVPMMELNSPEAITNNIQGTKNLVDLALRFNVEAFVMISTDKAVNPTNIMGASKRVAEMLVLQAARVSQRRFVVVRFGNVLGSRGSVIPTFKQQIAAGGPVTVTHPEITRYFMTIPEAVQLVLQAAVVSKGGEVLMLNMGQCVKIVDLAKEIIRLSGYEVGKDIEIVFTGLRPGEKLFEELLIPGEQYEPTEHDKLVIVKNASRFIPGHLNPTVKALCEAAVRNEPDLIRFFLKQLVPGYHSQSPVPFTLPESIKLPAESSRAAAETSPTILQAASPHLSSAPPPRLANG
ncbi:polysaccharide biosynthesis protein [Egbenema bharatensis]|uniref:polysaccharide biosynthesis protein n=1 Tax=Egbenema bharatensis TaxID=3463334 RepID=UPI003A89D819